MEGDRARGRRETREKTGEEDRQREAVELSHLFKLISSSGTEILPSV